MTGISLLLLNVHRRSVALGIGTHTLEKFQMLVDDCLNTSNTQAQFVNYLTNRDMSYQRECRAQTWLMFNLIR